MNQQKDWEDIRQRAISMARQFRRLAYAPYSKYTVGACVVSMDEGKRIHYHGGCNIENASYGLTICAKRVAIFNAVAHGYSNIIFMVIAVKDATGMSCGACRQVEHEFNPDMEILVVGENEILPPKIYHLRDVLPHAFGPENLNVKKEQSKAK